MINIIYKISALLITAVLLPLRLSAGEASAGIHNFSDARNKSQTLVSAEYWTGNSVFKPEEQGIDWGISASQITKVLSPGRAYSVKDIGDYSAYVTNEEQRVGNTLDKSFYWYNRSRLAYVKLFKVTGGQEISFVFSDEFYVYCAEFDSSFRMLEDGDWMATGQKCRLKNDTAWIMVDFRQVNGDMSLGGGIDTVVKASEIKNSEANYIVFEPFSYTFKMNGGNYYGSSSDYVMERLGVNKIALPRPIKTGYKFSGWKADNGKIYNEIISAAYDSELFKDTTFTAIWEEIPVSAVSLDREYAILEQNCGDSITLQAAAMPDNAYDKTLVWSSSDEEVARVDRNGVVTAGKTGEAVITVKASGGAEACCRIYVMGFEVKIPSSCEINKAYPIQIKVYNNGKEGMTGRKHVIIDTEQTVAVYRAGDEATSYDVVAETSPSYAGGYSRLKEGAYLADITDSSTIYYRLTPTSDMTRAGDYEGNVNFSVSVN